jgi:hypothetical protein
MLCSTTGGAAASGAATGLPSEAGGADGGSGGTALSGTIGVGA